MTTKLSVLIVEDEDGDRDALIAEINAHADEICLADALKSSDKAFEFIRNNKPHAVILDLQLQEGIGDGLALLDKLNSALICPKPYIVVNTNNASKTARESRSRKGVDYEFAKWQEGYTHKMVIDHLLSVKPTILGYRNKEQPTAIAKPSEQPSENKMRDFVQAEFNKLGVSVKNEGYKYLVEAVILAAKGENNNWGKIIGGELGKSDGSVTHAMQYAINKTWNNADINDLLICYTAPVQSDKGVPTVCEFVFFYAQKLISYMNK